jgi:hypothetical protein
VNKLLLSLAAIFAAGCASGPMNPAKVSHPVESIYTNNTPHAPKVGDTYGAFPTDRGPAQSYRTYWVEDSKAITVTPGGGSVNVVLNPSQIEAYPESYRYTCNQYTWGTGTCEDYVCEGGSGKSELWNAYYSAPGNQKAAALDRALMGIGESSARKLHASGIFNSKARSWQEFRERMNTALKRGVITDQQYSEVFGTYREQNRRNLGYAGENCRTQYYTCTVYGVFPVVNGCEGIREATRTISVLNKPIQVNISNPQLQSFETETVTVKSGPDFDSVEVLRGDKTDYQMSKSPTGNGAIVNLNGVGRYQVALPDSALVGVRFNDGRGQAMNAVVSIDPKFLGEGEDKLIVTLQATHCTPGGFWSAGDCKGSDAKSKIKLPPAYYPMNQATMSFALPSSIPAGDRVWVSYSIHRQGSKWYTSTPVASREERIKELKK